MSRGTRCGGQAPGVDSQVYPTQLLVNLRVVKPSELDEWLPEAWQKRQAALPPIA